MDQDSCTSTAKPKLVNALAVPTLGAAMAISSIALLPMPLALAGLFLAVTMTAISAIDARHFIIPNWLSLPSIPAGLLASGYLVDAGASSIVLTNNILGAVAGGAALWSIRTAYLRWRGIEGLGLGDVKLAAAGGAWVGLDLLAVMLLVAAVLALVITAAVAFSRGAPLHGRTRLPFGAFLAPSIWIIWMLAATGQIG